MVEDLEQKHALEARTYERLKSQGGAPGSPPSGTDDTQLADIEKRVLDAGRSDGELAMRLDRMKQSAASLSKG